MALQQLLFGQFTIFDQEPLFNAHGAGIKINKFFNRGPLILKPEEKVIPVNGFGRILRHRDSPHTKGFIQRISDLRCPLRDGLDGLFYMFSLEHRSIPGRLECFRNVDPEGCPMIRPAGHRNPGTHFFQVIATNGKTKPKALGPC